MADAGVDRASTTGWRSCPSSGTQPDSRARARLVFSVAANLIVLGSFKYANFFARQPERHARSAFVAAHCRCRASCCQSAFRFSRFTPSRTSSTSIGGDAIAQKSPVHAALYLLLFPQLIAGPIIRYRHIADQLARRVVTLDDFAGRRSPLRHRAREEGPDRQRRRRAGRQIFACRPTTDGRRTRGSASSATRCRSTSTSPATPTWPSAWGGCSAFVSRRISAGRTSPRRCRNSGAAGTSRCRRGFATTCTCRSAATACRAAQMYRNLVTVFFLCGLWHGASWNFVDLGPVPRHVSRRRTDGPCVSGQAPAGCRCVTLYVLLVVMVGWVFFRADTLPERDGVPAGDVRFEPSLRRRRSRSAWYLTPEVWLALTAGVIGSAPVIPALVGWRAAIVDTWRALGIDWSPTPR